jgi:PPK2 family polyphosphate:nucleotide phosphotransferase
MAIMDPGYWWIYNIEQENFPMTIHKLIEKAREISRPYRITNGNKFHLQDVNPGDTGSLDSEDKPRAQKILQAGIQGLSELQDMLYAQDQWAILLIFQAMDAAGKDSAIKHVMSGINPQGCQVASFKAPSAEELHHDFLWRCQKLLPERGRIGIFNRSYYEEVLIVRVHPEILQNRSLPASLVRKQIWDHRYEDICNFEHFLSRNGVVVRKFFLHVSREEQRRRFLERLENPAKNWKFSSADLNERARWNDYMDAYEDMVRKTASDHAPWYVVPADHKWFTRLVVAEAVIDALGSLDLKYPEVGKEKLAELATAKKALIREK